MSDPYPKPCPNCGHRFSLAELKTMAVGDGWRRFIFVRGSTGRLTPVDFNDFNPDTMVAVTVDKVAEYDVEGGRMGTSATDILSAMNGLAKRIATAAADIAKRDSVLKD